MNTNIEPNEDQPMDSTEQRLKERGIQPTAMRQRVLDYLASQPFAQSQKEIEKGMIMSDRATLYRTLKTLESQGFIHLVEDGTGSVRYAMCQAACKPGKHKDAHLHFHCHSCGRTYCLHQVGTSVPPLPSGYSAEEHYLLAKGTCPSCRI